MVMMTILLNLFAIFGVTAAFIVGFCTIVGMACREKDDPEAIEGDEGKDGIVHNEEAR